MIHKAKASMPKILINLVPVRSGGGLQNALSLINQLPLNKDFLKASLVVCENNDIYVLCKRAGVGVYRIRFGYLGRVLFEVIGGYLIAKKNNVKIIFTLFGNPPIFSPGYYKISGFALSNILYPEVPFWNHLPLLSRYYKSVKDFLRLWAAKRSDEIILETDHLYQRALSSPLKDHVLHVVRMEPSSVVLDRLNLRDRDFGCDYFRFLVLCGPHPNKRIEMLGAIFSRLEFLRLESGLKSPRLILTINEGHAYSKKIRDAFNRENVSHCLSFIGPIPQEKVGSLLSEVDCMVNISRLESFSNNWVEAWAANIPLVSTDAEWARASCAKAAIYIKPENPNESADSIFRTLSSCAAVQKITEAGKKQLADLAKIKKVDAYYGIIKNSLLRVSQ